MKDKLVPAEHSIAMHRALRRAGIDAQLILLRDRGHAFRLDQRELIQVAAFFRQHL